MIRVHLTEGAPPGEAGEATPQAQAADPDWKTLDDLARTALLLARRLREQQDTDERSAAGSAQNAGSAGSDVTTTAVTVSDLLQEDQKPEGAGAEAEADVPPARDSPDS